MRVYTWITWMVISICMIAFVYATSMSPKKPFHVVILSMDRPDFLHRLLLSLTSTLPVTTSLQNQYIILLSIHIDRREKDINVTSRNINEECIRIANSFDFSSTGYKSVILHDRLKDTKQAWMDAWKPMSDLERGVILEDDTELFPSWFLWLTTTWDTYISKNNIGIISLQRQAIISSNNIINSHNPFLHKLVTSSGISPHPRIWREFLEWKYSIDINNNHNPSHKEDSWTQLYSFFCEEKDIFNLHIINTKKYNNGILPIKLNENEEQETFPLVQNISNINIKSSSGGFTAEMDVIGYNGEVFEMFFFNGNKGNRNYLDTSENTCWMEYNFGNEFKIFEHVYPGPFINSVSESLALFLCSKIDANFTVLEWNGSFNTVFFSKFVHRWDIIEHDNTSIKSLQDHIIISNLTNVYLHPYCENLPSIIHSTHSNFVSAKSLTQYINVVARDWGRQYDIILINVRGIPLCTDVSQLMKENGLIVYENWTLVKESCPDMISSFNIVYEEYYTGGSIGVVSSLKSPSRISRDGDSSGIELVLDGGWVYNAASLQSEDDCIIYSIGIGQDTSWDEMMIKKYSAIVYAFDSSPQSLRHVSSSLRSEVLSAPRFHFIPESLSSFDVNKFHVSTISISDHEYLIKPNLTSIQSNSLDSWMNIFGHSHVEILRMDVGSTAYDFLLECIFRNNFPFTQLLVRLQEQKLPSADKWKHFVVLNGLKINGFQILNQDGDDDKITFQRALQSLANDSHSDTFQRILDAARYLYMIRGGESVKDHLFQVENERGGEFLYLNQIELSYESLVLRSTPVRQICEVGFSGGFKSLMYAIMYKGNVNIHVFDECIFSYSLELALIQRWFPNIQIEIFCTSNLQDLILTLYQKDEIFCDVISIDADGIKYLSETIRSFSLLANPISNILFVHSVNTLYHSEALQPVWKGLSQRKIFGEILSCTSEIEGVSQILPCVGFYIRYPLLNNFYCRLNLQEKLLCPGNSFKKCRGDLFTIFSIGLITGIGNINEVFPSLQSATNHGKPMLVATSASVSDTQAVFIADPFLFIREEKIFIFVEVLDNHCQIGKIGFYEAPFNDPGHFTYGGIILQEFWHLSFPFVVEWNNDLYMTTCATTGTSAPYSVWLYVAESFPTKWRKKTRILHEQTTGRSVDPVIFFHDEVWYLFVLDDGIQLERIFTSRSLTTQFVEHPASRMNYIRHSGPLHIGLDGKLWAFHHSGTTVIAVQIVVLSESEFKYEPNTVPVLGPMPEHSWARSGMHSFGILPYPNKNNSFVAVVDGFWSDNDWIIHKCLERGYSSFVCHTIHTSTLLKSVQATILTLSCESVPNNCTRDSVSASSTDFELEEFIFDAAVTTIRSRGGKSRSILCEVGTGSAHILLLSGDTAFVKSFDVAPRTSISTNIGNFLNETFDNRYFVVNAFNSEKELVLGECDLIVQTSGSLISKSILSLVKPGTIVINTSSSNSHFYDADMWHKVGSICLPQNGHCYHAEKKVSDAFLLARRLSQKHSFVYVLFLNFAYVELTKNWICNVDLLQTVLPRTLLIVTDSLAFDALKSFKPTLNVALEPFGSSSPMEYGKQEYHQFSRYRENIILGLLRHNVSVWLVEADAFWVADPSLAIPDLLSFDMMAGQNTDLLLQSGFLFLQATEASVKMYGTFAAALATTEKMDEMFLLTHFAYVTPFRFKWSYFDPERFVDGKYYTDENIRNTKTDVIVIQNNWIVGNEAKKQRCKTWNHWFLSDDSITCRRMSS